MSNVIAQIPGTSHRQKRDWFEAGIVQVSYGSGTDLEGFAGVGHVDKAAPVVFDWRREASFVKGSQSEGLLEISAIMKDFFLVKNLSYLKYGDEAALTKHPVKDFTCVYGDHKRMTAPKVVTFQTIVVIITIVLMITWVHGFLSID